MNLQASPFNLDSDAVAWVTTTREALTRREKVGQLFCLLAAPANPHDLGLLFDVAEPGGFMHRPSTAGDIRDLNQALQNRATLPLLIAANLETGPDGVASDATSFGTPLQVAATDQESHAHAMGQVCAVEAAALGVNWAFSPIVDIQFNFQNPITNTRTFGSDPARVLRMGSAFLRGLHDGGLAASIKHWPGDGVDDRDQHLVTTVNTLNVADWEASFGIVYRGLIAAGASTLMAGHISLPHYSRALRPGIADADILPASLAPEITTTLLREHLGFQGLVVTDASTMAGLEIPLSRRELVPATIAAGCDMFLFSPDYALDFDYMMAGVDLGIITEERLDEAVTRVLALKASLGLHRKDPAKRVPGSAAWEGMDHHGHENLARKAAGDSITLVKNLEPGLLPLSPITHGRVLIYSLRGPNATTAPADRLAAALRTHGFVVERFEDTTSLVRPDAPLGVGGGVGGADLEQRFDTVIYLADVHPASNVPTVRLHWTPRTAGNVPKFIQTVPTIFISIGSPFHLQDVPRIRTFINAYAHTDHTIDAVVERLIGAAEFRGQSPVDPFCGYWDAHL